MKGFLNKVQKKVGGPNPEGKPVGAGAVSVDRVDGTPRADILLPRNQPRRLVNV
jgi:hypothetical protein